MHLRKGLLTVLIVLVFVLLAGAGEDTNIPEVGAHYCVLMVEKNVNAQNKMVIYTKVDADGRFASEPANRNRPLFDFYWLMQGRDYKPVHALIKSELHKRFESKWTSGDQSDRFTVKLNDLKEVDCDIKEPKMDVYSRGTGSQRSVEAELNLGPSDRNIRIRISSLYTEGRAFPPAVYSVTLSGKEIVNGDVTSKMITRKYRAKP